MKNFKTIYLIVAFCLSSSFLFSQTESIITDTFGLRLFKSKDLPSYLSRLATNDNFQLERLSAYLFHQEINEYRIKNGKSWLFWNEDMWLAARNHNIYMLHQFILTHGENPDSLYFTGSDSESRYIYVADNPVSLSGSGENVFFSMGELKGDVNQYELAKSIADHSFENWKESPGHNENMLSESYNMQGTAFIYLGLLYATTVFGNDRQDKFEINEINLSWDNELVKKVKPNFVIQNRDVYSSTPEEVFISASEQTLMGLMNDKSKLSDELREISFRNLQYIKANSQNTTVQVPGHPYYYAKTTKRRLYKALEDFTWMEFLFAKVFEKTAYIEFALSDFFTIKRVLSHIDVETAKDVPDPIKVEKWGYSIDFYKKSNYYVFVINCIFILK